MKEKDWKEEFERVVKKQVVETAETAEVLPEVLPLPGQAGTEEKESVQEQFSQMFGQVERVQEEEVKTLNWDIDGRKSVSEKVRLDKVRKKDKKVSLMSQLFGFVGFGEYAVDKETARRLFETRLQQKPVWAVMALVVLRDSGMCRVCGEAVSTKARMKKWQVRQLVLSRDGGKYSEGNCILVCEECDKVWNPNKEFFLGGSMQSEFRKLCFYVIRRRQEGRNGALPLSAKSEQHYIAMRSEEKKWQKKQSAKILKQAVENEQIPKSLLEQALR